MPGEETKDERKIAPAATTTTGGTTTVPPSPPPPGEPQVAADMVEAVYRGPSDRLVIEGVELLKHHPVRVAASALERAWKTLGEHVVELVKPGPGPG